MMKKISDEDLKKISDLIEGEYILTESIMNIELNLNMDYRVFLLYS